MSAAATVDVHELAGHIDRIRRRWAPCRQPMVVREIPGGWLTARPDGADASSFPAGAANRIFWLSPGRVLTDADIAATATACRGLRCNRMHVWLAPWAWDENVERTLERHGATRWPNVDYFALARPTDRPAPTVQTRFDARPVPPGDARAVMDHVRHWFGDEAAAAITTTAERGVGEVHAAFDGPTPIAIGVLLLDGQWGYLGAAHTSPDHRALGAQSALIASRVRRAADAGARWCASETNTATPTSLSNLRRFGFVEAIQWHVYHWELAGD